MFLVSFKASINRLTKRSISIMKEIPKIRWLIIVSPKEYRELLDYLISITLLSSIKISTLSLIL